MIVVYPSFRIRSDQTARYRTEANRLIEGSLQEPGVTSYGVYKDISSDNLYVHVEVYTNQAAFDAHLQTAHVGRFVAFLEEAVAETPDISLFRVTEHEIIVTDL